MGGSMSVAELAALTVKEVADLEILSEYRQAVIDFGIDGEMLTRLPTDQLADALGRAGVDDKQQLDYFLVEIEKIRSPKMDPSKLDRKNLRELLELSDSFDWDERSDTSEWSGISLDNEDRILGLNVANRNLSGELPAALGEISNLEYIHAASNSFTGAIPDAIGGLASLTSLRLDHNSLSGRLPGSMTRLTNLTALDLAWNKITGTIPMKMGTMTSLRSLNLGMNKLNGAIPRELGSLHFLVELRVRENKLAGKIPPLLSNMRSLQVLDLTSNTLQGHIPESLGAMTDLRELWLGGNNLVGGVPEALSKLDYLQSLDLSRNKFAGKTQPAVFSALSPSLVYLNLSHNAFEGHLPLAALSPHTASETAAARGLGSSLSYLNLSHNKFTGPIPEAVGELISLETLDLSHNKLEGAVPRGIGNCVALRVLSFSRCGLSGRLDGGTGGALGRLRFVETLRLDANTFEGCVPASLGNLTRLEVLQLQCNCFSGHLPSTLGQLDRLWTLTVRDNNISGRVPDSLGRLTGLRSLRLEDNPSLQGPIPRPLASRSDCAVRADALVLHDTEATMLGSRLGDWFLMPRKNFLNLQEFPGYTSVRPCLLRHVSTVVPYECHVFVGAKGRRIVVRRKEMAFFSHCWDLPPDKCPPKPGLLEGPHPDTPDNTKLRHMKACLEGAPSSVQYVWVDMLCVALAEPKRRRAAGRSLPFFVQNSGRFYVLAPDSASLERHKKRAWCRLEALCAACPYQRCQLESAFSAKPASDSAAARFVYDSVEFFVSTWEKGARYEARINCTDDLEAAGFLSDPVAGKLSDPRDRKDVAESAVSAVDVMEMSGRINPAVAKIVRFSAKRVLYGSQGWEGQEADEEELLSLQSEKTGGGSASKGMSSDGRFSRKLRAVAPRKAAAASQQSVQ